MVTIAKSQPRASEFGAAWEARLRELGAEIFRRRTKLSLLEWSEKYRKWPDDSPYRADATPHVREILNAYSDPAVEEITIVKPTQSGLTEGFALNAVGYHVDEDPRDLLIIIPSVDEAEKWSKKKLQPMIDATPRIQGKLEDGSRKASNTILEKSYPGGSVGIVGSNSGRGFRMVTIGVAIGDDVEGWDATAGRGPDSEGDQVTLIRRRTDRVPDRKLAWISTPRLAGGRIHRLYNEMEGRGQYHVPCPHCGEMQVLRWGGSDTPFGIKWEQKKVSPDYDPEPGEVVRNGIAHLPDTAYYLCEASGCVIGEEHKPAMEARGEYLDEDLRPIRRPGVRSLGFWLRGALTITLPGSEWPRLVREFLKVKDNTEALRAFFNLVLAEFWEDKGEAPEWERIYERRENYPLGTCPEGVVFLTAGVDVQQDRLEAAVWGWGNDKESWLVDYLVIEGSPTDQRTWDPLTELLASSYPASQGMELPIARLAVDTGYEQESVISWARRVGDRRVMLVKGDHWKNWTVIVGTPKKSETSWKGKRYGLLLWSVGGALIKQETYGFLRLDAPLDDEAYPPGWIHLPMVDVELCKQLVAEELVTRTDARGFARRDWEKKRPRNEFLDNRVYARAAAEQVGLARMVGDEDAAEKPTPKTQQKPERPRPPTRGGRGGGWLDNRKRGGWL